MSEDTLARLRAESFSPEQLVAEIARIDHAKTKAARPREIARYDRKRAIYAAELERQVAAARPAKTPVSEVMRPNREWD